MLIKILVIAIKEEVDIVSKREAVEVADKRILVGDTDVGKKMRRKIKMLKKLITAYQSGEVAEREI